MYKIRHVKTGRLVKTGYNTYKADRLLRQNLKQEALNAVCLNSRSVGLCTPFSGSADMHVRWLNRSFGSGVFERIEV
jgi:hypothetical protein